MLRHKRILPILALLCLFPFIASPKEPIRTEEGVVRHVADGDTVTVVTHEGTKLRIRLYGIDASETAKVRGPGSWQGQVSRTERGRIRRW